MSTHRDDIPSRHPVSAESDALYGTNTDLEERKEVEALLAGENRLLERLAEGASLESILDGVCRLVSDVTESKLAEETIRRNEAELRQICKLLRRGLEMTFRIQQSTSSDDVVVLASAETLPRTAAWSFRRSSTLTPAGGSCSTSRAWLWSTEPVSSFSPGANRAVRL